MKFQRKQAKGQKGKAKGTGESGDAILAKKSFHFLKLVHKEIKKAKQFEIRKIVRRIKQAASDGTGQDAAAVEKLQSQLAAARAANVDALTSHVAQACGLQQQQPQQQQGGVGPSVAASSPATAAAAEGAPEEPAAAGVAQAKEVLDAVSARIAAAKCVRDQAAAARRELDELAKKMAGAAAKAEAAAAGAGAAEQQQGTGAVGAVGGAQAPMEQPGEAEGAAAPLGASSDKKREGREAKAKAKPPPELDGTAEGALAKLLAGRGRLLAEQGGAGEGSGSESEADSGLVGSEEEEARGLARGGSDSEFDSRSELSGEDAEEGSSGSEDEGEGPPRAGKQAGGQQAQQRPQQPEGGRKRKAAPPPKSRNRLGQRARRKMAAQMFGRTARHFQQREQQQQQAGGGPGGAPAVQGTERPRASKPPTQQAVAPKGDAEAAAMHPSWAAKRQQKLQISIGAPAAKKIKFDDEGAAPAAPRQQVAPGGHGPSAAARTGTSAAARPITAGAKGRAQQGQQRQQQSRGPAAAAGPLHPSWEAKKKAAALQKSMPKPAGTKITFDD